MAAFADQLSVPLFQQSNRHIIDVGAGGAGHDQAAGFLQGVVGVVVLQDRVHGEPLIQQFPAASRVLLYNILYLRT